MSFYIDNFRTIFGNKSNIQTLRNKVLGLAIHGNLTSDINISGQSSELLFKSISESKFQQTGQKCKKISSDVPERKKYPRTWQFFRIGDLFQLINGRAFKPSEWSISGFPIIRIQNLNNYNAPFNYCNFEVEDKFIVNNNDILIGWSGTPGTSFGAFVWNRGKGVLNQHIFKAIPYFEMNREFLKYSINSKLNEMISKAHGGVGLQHITKGKFEEIIIPIPSPEEQDIIVNKIKSLMSQIDKLEELLQEEEHLMEMLPEAVVDTVENCKNGEELKGQLQFIINNFETIFQTPESLQELRNIVLQLAIEGKLVPQDPNDEPASKLIKKIKIEKDKLVKEGKIKKEKPLPKIEEDEIPFEIPESWEWVRLNEISSLITKGSSPKWQGISYTDKKEVLFITSENVGNNKLLMDNKKYVENKFNEIEPRSILARNDILMNIVGASIGRTAIYDLEDVANINQAVCLIRVFYDHINLKYLLQFFNSKTCISYMYDKQVDNARANLSMSNIAKFPIPIPPLQEQSCIVTKVESIMSLINQMENKMKYRNDLVGKMASM